MRKFSEYRISLLLPESKDTLKTTGHSAKRIKEEQGSSYSPSYTNLGIKSSPPPQSESFYINGKD